MRQTEFLARMAEILQARPGAVEFDTPLVPETFDSLAILSTIAAIDEIFGAVVPAAALARCRTVSELLALIAETTGAAVGGG
jgi:acyl carrier protein